MVKSKISIRAFFAVCVIFFLAGCETFNDLVSDNSFILGVAVRHGVINYIESDQKISAIEMKERAADSKYVLVKVKNRLNENTVFAVSDLVLYASETIDWGQLTISEQEAIKDILLLVDLSFKESKEIPETTKTSLNIILNQAILATELF